MTEAEEAILEYYNKAVRLCKDITNDDRLTSEQKVRVLGVIF